jgi:hypothetical protein
MSRSTRPAVTAISTCLFDDGRVEPFTDGQLAKAISGLGKRLGVEIDAYELIVHARRA